MGLAALYQSSASPYMGDGVTFQEALGKVAANCQR